MEEETLTAEAVHKTLEDIVAEYGEDYIYTDDICQYGDPETGEPLCIVGHVLYRLEPAAFRRIIEGWGSNTAPLSNLTDVQFDEAVGNALSVVQAVQDLRMPWGEALGAFENVLGFR